MILPHVRRMLAASVLARLSALRDGRLILREAGGVHALGVEADDGLLAEVAVHDERFWSAVALRGSVGAGEAWAEGWWTSPDPVAVVRLFARNRERALGLESGLARLSELALRPWHALRRNTRRGSRRNVAAHYDLSNEFFALMLDDTLTYSCGIFERDSSTLREASLAKIDRLLDKLALRPGEHLLEIGTGWGALAIRAARRHGVRVTSATISRAQHELATRRVAEAGLEGRVEVLLCDWRDLRGRYDALVSVEMIEAVGHEYYAPFFAACARLLSEDGRMALQAITIADDQYERARRSVDFIRRHVFPGSCIPSTTALSAAMARASDLRLVHLEELGPHYARTLRAWRENLAARRDEALALGLDERFLRLWEFYLVYCEGGFAERYLGDVQLVLARPRARLAPLLPTLGATLGASLGATLGAAS